MRFTLYYIRRAHFWYCDYLDFLLFIEEFLHNINGRILR